MVLLIAIVVIIQIKQPKNSPLISELIWILLVSGHAAEQDGILDIAETVNYVVLNLNQKKRKNVNLFAKKAILFIHLKWLILLKKHQHTTIVPYAMGADVE